MLILRSASVVGVLLLLTGAVASAQASTEPQAGQRQAQIANPVAIASQSIEQTTETASVSGTVLDASGAVVAGADVTVTERDGSTVRSTVTGANGTFALTGLPGGSYALAITAQGFQPYTSATFTVTAQQAVHVASLVLSIAAISTTVDVRPTEVIAAQQMRAEEKQRILGAIPNFYTSYVWNAAPLNTAQKFSLASRAAIDPMSFIGTSLGAGIEQASHAYPGYGRGLEGYGRRWGASFADEQTRELLSRAVFPSLFHQDPRYFYQGSGSTWSRIRHAVGDAFVARSDMGHLMPNYSYLLSSISAGALSNLYYPASSRGVGLVFTNAAIGMVGRAGQNLVREFIAKHLTTHVPGRPGKAATSSENP